MIRLTNSALRYASNICFELPNYVVSVFIDEIPETDEILKKLKSFTKNKHATVYNNAFMPHIDFENGSRIRIILAHDNARGYRCNIAIVSPHIDKRIIDEVIRPCELYDDFADTNNVNHNTNNHNTFNGFGDYDTALYDLGNHIANTAIAQHIDADNITTGYLNTDIANITTITADATITNAIDVAIGTTLEDAINNAVNTALENALANRTV